MLDDLFNIMDRATAQGTGRQLADARVRAVGAESEARNARRKAESAEIAVARLELVARTLYELGLKRNLWTREEFLALMEEIDARDGRVDGQLKATAPRECPACGKRNGRRVNSCIYCGQDLPSHNL
jgi:hypothetical protein